MSAKTTISSVLGTDYTEPIAEDENVIRRGGIGEDINESFAYSDDLQEETIENDDDESEHSLDECDSMENQVTFSPFCEKITRKKELPTPLFAGKIMFTSFLYWMY